MKLKNIIEALNHYYLKRFPNAKGWFIGKEYSEPTKLNAYRKYRVEIYYHIPSKNTIAFTVQMIDRCINDSEDILRERALTALLEEIFTNITDLDKYETT